MFVTTSDHSAASHQILEKLRGAYTYTCPVHQWPFEVRLDRENWLRLAQHNLSRPAYGSTVIESRYPTFDYSSPNPTLRSEVSIVNTVHLQTHRDGCFAYSEVFILRLEGREGQEAFSLWRAKRRSDGAAPPPVSSLSDNDLEPLGYLHMKSNQVKGDLAHQYQSITLEMRRTTLQMDDAEDYVQPWELFKICMYVGPGVASTLAGKQAGFEIRRSEPYWLFTEKEGLYDWRDGRVELFTPADSATEAKWMGIATDCPVTAQSKMDARSMHEAREDSVMWPAVERGNL